MPYGIEIMRKRKEILCPDCNKPKYNGRKGRCRICQRKYQKPLEKAYQKEYNKVYQKTEKWKAYYRAYLKKYRKRKSLKELDNIEKIIKTLSLMSWLLCIPFVIARQQHNACLLCLSLLCPILS
jgi:uncharacterized Zn finger protein (UPF0148 family)